MAIEEVSDNGSDGSSLRGYNEKVARNSFTSIPQNAELVTAQGNIVTNEGVISAKTGKDHSESTNIFKDPEIAAYYRQVYEDSTYECRHVFDPHLTWTKEEEKALIRKLDWRVCFWACFMFFSL